MNKLRHPQYATYYGMLSRCYNSNHKSFKYYGGRGITVCEEWRDSFTTYVQDVGIREDGMTLDRIDNNGNYEPLNVRWATPKEQSANSRGANTRQGKYFNNPEARLEYLKHYKREWRKRIAYA